MGKVQVLRNAPGGEIPLRRAPAIEALLQDGAMILEQPWTAVDVIAHFEGLRSGPICMLVLMFHSKSFTRKYTRRCLNLFQRLHSITCLYPS